MPLGRGRRSVMNFRKTAIIVGVLCLSSNYLLADGVSVRFHVPADRIARTVLVDAIGLCRLKGMKEKDTLATYVMSTGAFRKSGAVRIHELIPLSSFGYQPREPGWIDYSFPITRIHKEFIEIVLDPERDNRAWIKKTVETGTVFTEIIDFNNLELPKCCVDVFFLSREPDLVAYARPMREGKSTPITPKFYPVGRRRKWQENRYIALDMADGFLKIGLLTPTSEAVMLDPKIDPIGWIPMRDKEGRLSVWFIQETPAEYPLP